MFSCLNYGRGCRGRSNSLDIPCDNCVILHIQQKGPMQTTSPVTVSMTSMTSTASTNPTTPTASTNPTTSTSSAASDTSRTTSSAASDTSRTTYSAMSSAFTALASDIRNLNVNGEEGSKTNS